VTAIRATLQRSGPQPDEIGALIKGNAVQASNKVNPARQAAIHGGLPVQVTAMTVNRVCGSGAQAIVSAAHETLMDSVDAAIAGGMENMDAAPYLVSRGRWGHRLEDGALYDSVLRDGLNDAFSDAHSGWHTEDLVTKFQMSRAKQDEWALRSHTRFSAAQSAGKFEGEIVPVEVPARDQARFRSTNITPRNAYCVTWTAHMSIRQRRFSLIRTIAGSGPLHYLEPDGANASAILSINRRTRFGWTCVAG
jgi:acetyl-CoA C-acetyltransferase